MQNTQLQIQNFRLSLKRFPQNHFDKSLRAWDAADEYLIDYVAEHTELKDVNRIVIFNDSFGALACAMSKLLPASDITVFTDSYMSELGIMQNLRASNLDNNKVNVLSVLDSMHTSLTSIDVVLLKIPRTLAYLDYMLCAISQISKNDHQSKIVGAGMVKLVTSSSLKKFDKYFKATTTSLARKKSRLIFTEQPHTKQDPTKLGSDEAIIKKIDDPVLNFTLCNYPNVFCRDQVDIGARYMLKSMPPIHKQQVVVDLGCGNGILGCSLLLQASQEQKDVHMIFVDEAYMAIASAQKTLQSAFGAGQVNEHLFKQATFCVDHSLHTFLQKPANHNSADLVLCNPPFHQQSTQLDDIAWQMFVDAHKVLKVGGELRIVGNRHLEHRAKLSKLFGGCKVIASDKKFVVLSSMKE